MDVGYIKIEQLKSGVEAFSLMTEFEEVYEDVKKIQITSRSLKVQFKNKIKHSEC